MVDGDKLLTVEANKNMEHSQTPFVANPPPLMMDDVIHRQDVPREPATQPPSLFMRAVRKVFGSAKPDSARYDAMPDEARRAEVEAPAPDAAHQGLSTQITDIDRAHMQAFSQERKAAVMAKIMTLTPLQTVVHQGGNQFEKAVLNMHREKFLLIDLQPHETAFTTVWYRDSRLFLGKQSDVTMLLWEDGEVCDSTTIMTWRI